MNETLGFKFVRPDLTTPLGGKPLRYLPGTTVESCHTIEATNTTGCPRHAGDGLCVAHTIQGAQSGGLPAHVMVLVSYSPDDVLGHEANESKVRVKRLRVLDIIDVPRWLRRYGYGTNLSGANLSGANLSGADLYRANLYGANLSGANLSGAYLSGADLSGAYLSGANLSGANLSGANLYRANLYGANLSGAYLYRANLSGAFGDERTRLPAGWVVCDGRIERAS